jgi:small-conductance mechanosensitive channel
MTSRGGSNEKGVRKVLVKLLLYLAAFAVTDSIQAYVVSDLLPRTGLLLPAYEIYIQVGLAVVFGYLAISDISDGVYLSLRAHHERSTALAVSNMVKILGLGGMGAVIAGGVAGGAAGVALGGFGGIVIGFASQQVLGQALSGVFLLTTRPFKVDDLVSVSGEDGVVADMSTLFTKIQKDDGTVVLIPNNSILGNKVYLRPKKTTK